MEISNQYLFTGRGPFDKKSLIKTYADLLNIDSWLTQAGNNVAYNGMIVAVWLNKEDTTKNGVYYLYDPTIKNAFKAPDVTKESNWHKLAEVADITAKLAAIDDSFGNIEDRLEVLEARVEQESQITFAEYNQFPSVGEPNKLYIALDEKASFIWDGHAYVSIGGETTDIDIKLIDGGSALNN